MQESGEAHGGVVEGGLEGGRTDFHRFSSLAAEYGIDFASPATRILDWGCGCGRLTRHWLALPRGQDRVFGADIDPVNLV